MCLLISGGTSIQVGRGFTGAFPLFFRPTKCTDLLSVNFLVGYPLLEKEMKICCPGDREEALGITELKKSSSETQYDAAIGSGTG